MKGIDVKKGSIQNEGKGKIQMGKQFVNSSGNEESEIDEDFSEDKKFAANMFGSDFDIELISNKDKEETMHILQEKSF